MTEKTASLIATAGQFGAMFSGAPASVTERIAPACAALGVAFQLSDDILDVASESAQSGKTPGTDLREGVRTLPVLHALRVGRAGRRAAGRAAERRRPDRLRRCTPRRSRLLRAHPAMEMAKADLRHWADLARAEILGLPDVPARAAFEAMCDFVVERTG